MNHIEINTKWCKGCGLCLSACPKKILELSAEINELGYTPAIVTNMNECIACTACALMCPDMAITVFKD